MKKSLTFGISLVVLGAGLWAAWEYGFEKTFTEENCPFCNPAIVESQSVYREKGAIALFNYKPAVKGHMLIIPERHVERFEELTAEEASQIHAMITRVNQAEQRVLGVTGYILLQKNGVESGQSVPHVHFHYFPRKAGESKIGLIVKMFAAHLFPPLSERELEEQKLRFQGDGLVD